MNVNINQDLKNAMFCSELSISLKYCRFLLARYFQQSSYLKHIIYLTTKTTCPYQFLSSQILSY